MKLPSRKSYSILLPLALLVIASLACSAEDLPFVSQPPPAPTQAPPPRATDAPASEPVPTPLPLEPTPPPEESFIGPEAMLDMLATATRPGFDPYAWGIALGFVNEDVDRTLDSAPEWAVGDVETFYVGPESGEFVAALYGLDPLLGTPAAAAPAERQAELVAVTNEFYVWLDATAVEGIVPSVAQTLATQFASDGYQAVRDLGGEEWTPGVDADERIHLVILSGLEPGTDAQFRRADEYPSAVFEPSVEREALYVALDTFSTNPTQAQAGLTREYWRMSQFNGPYNGEQWAVDGLGAVAQDEAGYDVSDALDGFLASTDTRLNGPATGEVGAQAATGASYLFHRYLAERAGEQADALPQLAASSPLGLFALDETVDSLGLGDSVDALFFDWAVANLIDDPELDDGRFGYADIDAGDVCPVVPLEELPAAGIYPLDPYAVAYHELLAGTNLTLDFQGGISSPLSATAPFAGSVAWWSGRGPWTESFMSRRVDLTNLQTATLDFALWYDIAPGEDAAYILVSTDGGETWVPQAGTHVVAHRGVSAYTGVSGGGDEPAWLQERVDLSAYAGQEIELAFAYVTADDGSGDGVMIDSIAITRAGLSDGAEAVDSAWDVSGWLRTSNAVANSWAVFVVTEAPGEFGQLAHTVISVEIGSDGTASLEQPLPDGVIRSWVVVARAARGTNTAAEYMLSLDGDFDTVEPVALPPGGLAAESFESSCGLFRQASGPTFSDTIADGVLTVDVTVPGERHLTLAGGDYEDSVLSVDVTLGQTQVTDSLWGAICRYQGSGNYYGFQVRNDGTHNIFVVQGGSRTDLTLFEVSEAILINPGDSNNMVASCVDTTLGLTINGEVVASVENDTFSAGQVGLMVATGEVSPVTVQFDNFVLTGPTGEGLTEEEEEAVGVCDCSANIYNCADFSGRPAAQSCFDFCGGRLNDVHLLDADFDGYVCETVFP